MVAIRTDKDWHAVRVTDALASGGTRIRCDRCNAQLRWVHVLTNDEHAVIRVGCCCAVRLCRGYDAVSAEREAINRGVRLLRFLDSRQWRTSKASPANVWRDVPIPDGSTRRVTVFEKRGRFGVFVAGPRGANVTPFDRFDTPDAAKAFAFEVVDAIKSECNKSHLTPPTCCGG